MRLSEYSHLAFTSRNGIQAVLERLAAQHQGSWAATADVLNKLPIHCCALGADAGLLQSAGVLEIITPEEVGFLGGG